MHIYWMKRHLIKKNKIDEVGDPDCQERASLSVSICRLPWKMKKTMADGEKDEAERGKHQR